jgi:hypothetical protein
MCAPRCPCMLVALSIHVFLCPFLSLSLTYLSIDRSLCVSGQVNELSMDYTLCPNITNGARLPANVLAWSFNATTSVCTLTFNIAAQWSQPVFMYYGLTKYAQTDAQRERESDGGCGWMGGWVSM